MTYYLLPQSTSDVSKTFKSIISVVLPLNLLTTMKNEDEFKALDTNLKYI